MIPSSSSELNVTWLAPPRDQQNGVITHYIIVITEVMTNITIQYTSNVTWYLAYNLHPHYTYSINIAAVTISQGPFLTGINITMPEAGKVNPKKCSPCFSLTQHLHHFLLMCKPQM